MAEDDPYAEHDAALHAAQDAYLTALKADDDPQRSLTKARDLAANVRAFAKTLMTVVEARAVQIRDREKLTLAKLAQRFGVSVPAAQQWYDQGKQAEQAEQAERAERAEQREDAHG